MAITLNDNIKTNAPKPTDSRYLNNQQPWISVSEVNINIPESTRYQGLTVNIDGTEYWYKDGILDFDLVIKSSEVEFNPEYKRLDYGKIVFSFAALESVEEDMGGKNAHASNRHLFEYNDPNIDIKDIYFDGFMDIIAYDGGEIIRADFGVSFGDQEEMIEYINNNFSDNNMYIGQIIIYFYDLISKEIRPLTNIKGYNRFFAMLKGKNKTLSTGSANTVLEKFDNDDYYSRNIAVADMIIGLLSNIDSGYNSIEDEYYPLFWFSKARKTIYKLLSDETIISLEDPSARRYIEIDSGNIDEAIGDWRININYSKYITLDDGLSVGFIDKNNFAGVKESFGEYNSIIIAYCLQNGEEEEYTFLLKPVSIDTLTIDNNSSDYDLYALIESDGKYINKIKLDYSEFYVSNSMGGRVCIPQEKLIDLLSFGSGYGKRVKFFYKDKETGFISEPSRQTVVIQKKLRDNPIGIAVV